MFAVDRATLRGGSPSRQRCRPRGCLAELGSLIERAALVGWPVNVQRSSPMRSSKARALIPASTSAKIAARVKFGYSCPAPGDDAVVTRFPGAPLRILVEKQAARVVSYGMVDDCAPEGGHGSGRSAI
jgi:hypothetical protein